MMSIPDKNETIYQIIYTALKDGSSMKVLKEFGFFNYFIFPGQNFECKLILFFILILNFFSLQ